MDSGAKFEKFPVVPVSDIDVGGVRDYLEKRAEAPSESSAQGATSPPPLEAQLQDTKLQNKIAMVTTLHKEAGRIVKSVSLCLQITIWGSVAVAAVYGYFMISNPEWFKTHPEFVAFVTHGIVGFAALGFGKLLDFAKSIYSD